MKYFVSFLLMTSLLAWGDEGVAQAQGTFCVREYTCPNALQPDGTCEVDDTLRSDGTCAVGRLGVITSVVVPPPPEDAPREVVEGYIEDFGLNRRQTLPTPLPVCNYQMRHRLGYAVTQQRSPHVAHYLFEYSTWHSANGNPGSRVTFYVGEPLVGRPDVGRPVGVYTVVNPTTREECSDV